MFSIIIPTHDRPILLQRTLLSLASQTFKNFTTIIISDSANYVAPYEILNYLPGQYLYILRNDKPGPAISRNLGIDLVNTDYALFLDDDDTLEPMHLELLAAAISSYKDETAPIFYCDFKVIEEDRTSVPARFLKQQLVDLKGICRESVFVKNVIPNSCLVYPLSVLKSARFDPALILLEDWDYLLACLKKTYLVHIPINTVSIHKSYVDGAENVRRGNVNDEYLMQTMLEIYQRHRSPNSATSQHRIDLFSSLGVKLPETCL